jgi:hypothetical protein
MNPVRAGLSSSASGEKAKGLRLFFRFCCSYFLQQSELKRPVLVAQFFRMLTDSVIFQFGVD